jgi:hypothetical protein
MEEFITPKMVVFSQVQGAPQGSPQASWRQRDSCWCWVGRSGSWQIIGSPADRNQRGEPVFDLHPSKLRFNAWWRKWRHTYSREMTPTQLQNSAKSTREGMDSQLRNSSIESIKRFAVKSSLTIWTRDVYEGSSSVVYNLLSVLIVRYRTGLEYRSVNHIQYC